MIITPTDHAVPHKSTVPANAGQVVDLFVREYDGTQPNTPPAKRRAVLMLHGRTVPALATFDVGTGDYSWARELAGDHCDVFVMDLQGMGRSPRPEMGDPCNANPAHHIRVLAPNLPLTSNCSPSYPHQLGNSQSDWDEVHTVVEYIKKLHGVSKVDLIGNSAAAYALGPYAIQYPANVRSLMFQAPVFKPDGQPSAPNTEFGAPFPLPLSTPPYPMNLGLKSGVQQAWDLETDPGCPAQQAPGIVDLVWKEIMDSDDKGRTWGKLLPGGQPEGVSRQRQTFWWGWNKQTAPLHGVLGGTVPVLIVYGELDKTVTTAGLSVVELYKAIAGEKKLMFQLSCASHQMVWEPRRKMLHLMAKQWLKNTAVFGLTSGSYYVDDADNHSPLPV
ncbi:alpha/beta hydrolase [Streptomyces sp. NPDC058157]|uniref:alpha/beta hydrolase n=1 Tax=Streptomyces sp. NPDC058157 TaxID=3346360 RepID=UPI0036F16050